MASKVEKLLDAEVTYLFLRAPSMLDATCTVNSRLTTRPSRSALPSQVPPLSGRL